MVTAMKDHKCTFCFEPILKGERYERESIKPWDHPDNEGFSVMKAHPKCLKLWHRVGDAHDWMFPNDRGEWRELTEGVTVGSAL